MAVPTLGRYADAEPLYAFEALVRERRWVQITRVSQASTACHLSKPRAATLTRNRCKAHWQSAKGAGAHHPDQHRPQRPGCQLQGHYADAEPLYKRSLAI